MHNPRYLCQACVCINYTTYMVIYISYAECKYVWGSSLAKTKAPHVHNFVTTSRDNHMLVAHVLAVSLEEVGHAS